MKAVTTLVIFYLFMALSFGQGRNIDAELIILSPKKGDTIVSRVKYTYNSKFIIRNNGPDTLKVDDKYQISVVFSNVIYNPYIKNFKRQLLPNEEDTATIILKMTWDTDAYDAKFCADLIIKSLGSDSVKTEKGNSVLNNKQCVLVDHLSRLSTKSISTAQFVFYPNPTNGLLYYKSKNNNNNSVLVYKIYTLEGQEVFGTNTLNIGNENIIDLTSLQKGIYLLKLNVADKSIYSKIILQ